MWEVEEKQGLKYTETEASLWTFLPDIRHEEL